MAWLFYSYTDTTSARSVLQAGRPGSHWRLVLDAGGKLRVLLFCFGKLRIWEQEITPYTDTHCIYHTQAAHITHKHAPTCTHITQHIMHTHTHAHTYKHAHMYTAHKGHMYTNTHACTHVHTHNTSSTHAHTYTQYT